MPSVSQSQRNFFGMVKAVKAGHRLKRPKGTSPARWKALMRRVHKAAKGMSAESASHFANTPSKGLPRRARRRR